MTYKRLALLALMCLPLSLQANFSLRVDASAFFPSDSYTREIYGNIWADYGVVIDRIQPFCHEFKPISFFGGVNYLTRNGSITQIIPSEPVSQLAISTRIQLIPVTLGVKWIQPLDDCFEVFVGIAPKYYYMEIKGPSDFHTSKNGCGAYATLGTFFRPTKSLMVDLFCSYSYMKFSSSSLQEGMISNVSGLDVGGGLNWQF